MHDTIVCDSAPLVSQPGRQEGAEVVNLINNDGLQLLHSDVRKQRRKGDERLLIYAFN